MLNSKKAKQHEIQSLVGKIINIKPLVPCGKFQIDHLMRLYCVTECGETMVVLNNNFKRQLHFWLIVLQWTSIPTRQDKLTNWIIDCYTDAAGGSLETHGKGVGGVIPSLGWWGFAQWSKEVNDGSYCYEGKKVASNLSALELTGPLLIMASAGQELRGRRVRFLMDNSGSCTIWRKGYSLQCRLASTIVKAVACIAVTLGCPVDIQKIARCSCEHTVRADALSKAEFKRFRKGLGKNEYRGEPGRIPTTLIKWLARPTEDDDLGKKILEDMRKMVNIAEKW